MVMFFDLAFIISLILSILAIILIPIILIFRWKEFNILPKGLRFHVLIGFFPSAFLYAFATSAIAILYLILNSQNHVAIKCLGIVVTFSSQTIRNCFLTTVFERIFATYYLEKYTLSDKISLFWRLSTFSTVITMLYVCVYLYSLYVSLPFFSIGILSLYVTVIHAFTLIICTILYFLNKKMYMIYAYRITLKKRHQIMQNVKVLSFIFPSVLIYSIIAPIGSVIVNVVWLNNLPSMPLCTLHVFHNLSILIIVIRHCFLQTISNDVSQSKTITVVKNAFGQNLPAAVSNDKYFKDLREQWK